MSTFVFMVFALMLTKQTYEMFVKNLRGYRKIFDCFVFISISWLY